MLVARGCWQLLPGKWPCPPYPPARHRDKPPALQSSAELQQWLCQAHNEVSASIGKPAFNCRFASKRWGELECDSMAACKLVSRG